MKTYSIYTLNNPATNLIHYVGCTSLSLSIRKNQHIHQRGRQQKKELWIRSLLQKGIEPEIKKVVSIVGTQEQAWQQEIDFIDILRKIGHPLTNRSNGGGLGFAKNNREKEHQSIVMKRICSDPIYRKQARERTLRAYANDPTLRGRLSKSTIERFKKNPSAKSVKVFQYDLEGQLIGTFTSAMQAQKIGKYHHSAIQACLNGFLRMHRGYVWSKVLLSKQDCLKILSAKKTYDRGYKVYKYDLGGNIIHEYDSIAIASRENNTNHQSISACIRGRLKTFKGFVWKREEKGELGR